MKIAKLSTNQSVFVSSKLLSEKMNRLYDYHKITEQGENMDFNLGYNEAIRDVQQILQDEECTVCGADAFAMNIAETLRI